MIEVLEIQTLFSHAILIYQYNGVVIVPTQVNKMRAKLANLNDCAVPFLSRASVNMCWYHSRYGCV